MFRPDPEKKGYYIALAGNCFNCGEHPPLDFRGTRPFTLEGWVFRPSGFRAAATIFSKPGELIFGLTGAARVFVQRFPSKEILIGPTALKSGIWHHVGLTFDGSGMALFVNGLGDARASRELRQRPSQSSASCFEAPQALASQAVDVSNFRIWNVVRSDEEMFEAPYASIAHQPGLVFHYFPEVPRAAEPQPAAATWSEQPYPPLASTA